MQIRFPTFLGLGLLSALGCASYTPYGGGYGGSYGGAYAVPPGSYVAPGQVMAPGQIPPGQMPPPGGWQASPRAFTPIPNGPNDAPPYQPGQPNQLPPGGPAGPGSKPVPPPTGPLNEEEDDPLRKPIGMNSSNPAVGARLSGITDDSSENMAAFGDEAFKNPVPVHSASASQSINDPTLQTVQSRPNPYAFDSKGYSWLRGVVGMDPQDKSWFIEYNPDPAQPDHYSGKLTLVSSDGLETLLADDVVLVEGQVDPREHDRYGKPMYRVQVVKRLVPKNDT